MIQTPPLLLGLILLIVLIILVLAFFLIYGQQPQTQPNEEPNTGTGAVVETPSDETPNDENDIIEPPVVADPTDDPNEEPEVTEPITDEDEDTSETPEEEESDENTDDSVIPGDVHPYKTSRFDASKPLAVAANVDEIQDFFDFVMPQSGFPTGKPKYPYKFYKNPKGIPLKICEAKWTGKGVNTSKAWHNNYEKYSGQRFKWTSVEMKVLNMGKAKGTANEVRSKCGPQGEGIRIIAYHMPHPTVGGGGTAHISARFTFGVDHESGHAIGLPHSAALYMYPDSHPLLTTKYTLYNSMNNYGASNCIMGNQFKGESPGFCAGALYKLGWQPDGFEFIEAGKSYTIRNQMNFDSNLPVALCFRNFYTGVLMMIEYSGKDNKGFFDKSEFTHTDATKTKYKCGFIMSAYSKRPVHLMHFGTKHFETPYGWIFDVTKISDDEATLKVTYDPSLITYNNARFAVKTIPNGTGKLRVCMRLYDITTGDDIKNPPRVYNPNEIVLEDENGKIYNRTLLKKENKAAIYGEAGTGEDIPIFHRRAKDKNNYTRAQKFTGYGIRESEVKQGGDWDPVRGYTPLYFEIEHPSKQSGSAKFKMLLNKNNHCMVKIFDFEFK